MDKFINRNFVYAVVGASKNREKYGFKVLKDLKDAGFSVIPVNPHENSILGLRVYKSLSEIPRRVDVVITVVKPVVTKEIVKECKKLGIRRVWMQPGSEDEEAIAFCRNNGINVVFNTCIMVEKASSDVLDFKPLQELND